MINEKWILDRANFFKNKLGCGRPCDVLGEGSYGIVFTTDSGAALKLTTHNTEAKTVAIIHNLQEQGVKLPGLVDIYNIKHFKAKRSDLFEYSASDGDRDFFVIVRELLEPANSEFTTETFNHYLGNMDNFEKSRYRKNVVNELGEYPFLQSTLLELAKRDLYLWDIRCSNVGLKKDGRVAIHDIVAAYPLPSVTIESLGIIR